MNSRRDGTLVSWWRYFLIFMGVSFNKVRAVHGLSAAEEIWIDGLRESLRRLAQEESVLALLDEANAHAPAHFSETTWKHQRLGGEFLSRFLKPAFTAAAARAGIPSAASIYLNQGSGEKVAFTAKPKVWNHFDQNVHRFPMAGQEYTEIVLKVTFDPDSEIRAVDIGVPVRRGEEPIGSLVAHMEYADIQRLANG